MESSDYFILTKERLRQLFENATIVFDTCALGRMYFMTPQTMQTMAGVLEFFKDRIWIPAHVAYEYANNREEQIKNLIARFYSNPSYISTASELQKKLAEFICSAQTQPDRHPFIDEDVLKSISEKYDIIKQACDDLKESTKTQLNKRKEEILGIVGNDCIKDVVDSFEKGVPFKHKEIVNIMREGEFRYRNNFPPGYMDNNNARKLGSQKYGDLIIWKEILRYARDNQKSVMFITNDEKIDWFEEHEKKKEPTTPRHELIKEFQDETGQDVWFFTLNQYVDLLIKNYQNTGILPFYKGLDAVKDTLAYQRAIDLARKAGGGNSFIVRCTQCGEYFEVSADDVSWDWEIEETEDREMGVESLHTCTHYAECPRCEKEIEINFNVWEYPEGVINEEDIDSDDAVIKTKIHLDDYIDFSEYGTCVICGRYAPVDSNDYCEYCANRIDKMMKDDD